MKSILIHLAIVFLIMSCSQEKEVRNVDIYEIKNIGELSTTEYTVGKIIKLNDEANEWYEYGERKILISCKAKIKAGVNLSLLEEGDIVVSGKKIVIHLPTATITSFEMNPNDIHTEMESISGFRDKFTQTEKNLFLKQGEVAIRKDLRQTEIIKDANDNAGSFIKEFYRNLGFEEIIVIPKNVENEK